MLIVQRSADVADDALQLVKGGGAGPVRELPAGLSMGASACDAAATSFSSKSCNPLPAMGSEVCCPLGDRAPARGCLCLAVAVADTTACTRVLGHLTLRIVSEDALQ